MCKACGCGKKKGEVGFGKGKPKMNMMKMNMMKKGSHKMQDGKIMKNSYMRKGKK